MLSIKDAPNPSLGGYAADQQCFDYDWARRLTQAWTPVGGDCTANRSTAALDGAEPYWTSYSYDVLGNRTNTVLHRPGGQGGNLTSTYTQPTSGENHPHATTQVVATDDTGQVGTSTFGYDAAGNMTARDTPGQAAQSLTWDREGELRGVQSDGDGDGTVQVDESDEYVYSADGDRLVRRQGDTTTVYLPGQELTITTSGNIQATRYYTFAGQTVAMRTDNGYEGATTIFADHHNTGSIQISNVTNTVTRRHLDPFGAPRNTAAGNPNNTPTTQDWTGDRGFIDKPTDTTGLTAIGARYYDPLLGAFISVDPVMDLTDPQQWHAYTYSNANPATWTDPTGKLLFNTIPGAGGKVNPQNKIRKPPGQEAAPSQPEPEPQVVPEPPTPPTSTEPDDGGGFWDGVGNALGVARDAISETASNTWGSIDSYIRSDGFMNGLQIAGTVIGVVGAGLCIAATAGACTVVGGLALAASGLTHGAKLYRGDESWQQAAGNFGIDLAMSYVPGARIIKNTQVLKMGRHSPLADYARRPGTSRSNITLSLQSAARHRPVATVARFTTHSMLGFKATTGNDWIE